MYFCVRTKSTSLCTQVGSCKTWLVPVIIIVFVIIDMICILNVSESGTCRWWNFVFVFGVVTLTFIVSSSSSMGLNLWWCSRLSGNMLWCCPCGFIMLYCCPCDFIFGSDCLLSLTLWTWWVVDLSFDTYESAKSDAQFL